MARLEYEEWRVLQLVVMKHGLWLDGDQTGSRARMCTFNAFSIILSGLNLSRLNLLGVDLSGVDLRGANLNSANFKGGNFIGADLTDSFLNSANFKGANLTGVNFRNALLKGANFTNANLSQANLENANLENVNLMNANLENANLTRTSLEGARLEFANLKGTCLDPASPVPPLDIEQAISDGFEITERNGRKVLRGWRTWQSVFQGETDYSVAGWYHANAFSISTESECHPGIYFSGEAWLDKCEYTKRKAKVRCWAYADETVKVRDKYRTKRVCSEGL